MIDEKYFLLTRVYLLSFFIAISVTVSANEASWAKGNIAVSVRVVEPDSTLIGVGSISQVSAVVVQSGGTSFNTNLATTSTGAGNVSQTGVGAVVIQSGNTSGITLTGAGSVSQVGVGVVVIQSGETSKVK